MRLIPKAHEGVEIDPRIIDDVIRRLKLVENNKDNPNGGWDKKNNYWKAHKSAEGGYDTIAWGIKLDPNNADIKDLYDLYQKQKYLTDEQVDAVMPKIVTNYYNRARDQYNTFGYNWDDLDWKAQSILTDYAYNPGIGRFPNFAKGFATDDFDLIAKNSHRALNGYALTERNKILDDEISDWIKTRKEDVLPQVWRYGIRPEYNEETDEIIYPVKNGKPAKAKMIVTHNTLWPNDTTIIAISPAGREVISKGDYGLLWDNLDDNFNSLSQRFKHDRKIALVKRRK